MHHSDCKYATLTLKCPTFVELEMRVYESIILNVISVSIIAHIVRELRAIRYDNVDWLLAIGYVRSKIEVLEWDGIENVCRRCI